MHHHHRRPRTKCPITPRVYYLYHHCFAWVLAYRRVTGSLVVSGTRSGVGTRARATVRLRPLVVCAVWQRDKRGCVHCRVSVSRSLVSRGRSFGLLDLASLPLSTEVYSRIVMIHTSIYSRSKSSSKSTLAIPPLARSSALTHYRHPVTIFELFILRHLLPPLNVAWRQFSS